MQIHYSYYNKTTTMSVYASNVSPFSKEWYEENEKKYNVTGRVKELKQFLLQDWKTTGFALTFNPQVPELTRKNEKFVRWWGAEKTFDDVKNVIGKKDLWGTGWLGSRWADANINGVFCRLYFYSAKYDSNTGLLDPYTIMLDPHSVERFQ